MPLAPERFDLLDDPFAADRTGAPIGGFGTPGQSGAAVPPGGRTMSGRRQGGEQASGAGADGSARVGLPTTPISRALSPDDDATDHPFSSNGPGAPGGIGSPGQPPSLAGRGNAAPRPVGGAPDRGAAGSVRRSSLRAGLGGRGPMVGNRFGAAPSRRQARPQPAAQRPQDDAEAIWTGDTPPPTAVVDRAPEEVAPTRGPALGR